MLKFISEIVLRKAILISYYARTKTFQCLSTCINHVVIEWVDNVTKHKYVATKDQQLGFYLSCWVIDITFLFYESLEKQTCTARKFYNEINVNNLEINIYRRIGYFNFL